MKDYIQHSGIIESIIKDKALVRITQKTSCSDCHAKSVCLSSDKKEKIIEVNCLTGKFAVNDEVIVSIQSSMGFFAIFLAFVVPLILVITSLAICISITGDEGISGVIGLSTLIPYYLILYVSRNKLEKKFIFTLSKKIRHN